MNEGLWGHALFLASKLDKRTHASVMTRFANSLPPYDPLQTLYQLHSGRVPAIVTVIITIFCFVIKLFIFLFVVISSCFFSSLCSALRIHAGTTGGPTWL